MHPAEPILRRLKFKYPVDKIQKLLKLMGENPDKAAFLSRKWALIRKRIAKLVHKYNDDAMEEINYLIPYALSEGANQTIYLLHRKLTPYAQGPPGNIKLDKKRDIQWLEKKIQTIAMSSCIREEFDPTQMSSDIIAISRNSMQAAAQASLYGAFDYGAYKAGIDAENNGIAIEKTWLGIMDARIRDSHKHLHNTTIPFDDVFHGLYGDLRFPHDPMAPPVETYRCRCRMVIHLAGKKYSAGMVLPSQMSEYRKWRDRVIREAGDEVKREAYNRKDHR